MFISPQTRKKILNRALIHKFKYKKILQKVAVIFHQFLYQTLMTLILSYLPQIKTKFKTKMIKY